MAESKPLARIKAQSELAGNGLGVVVAFIWNGYALGPQMGPEVAIPVAVLLGRVARYLLHWLPTKDNGD